MTSSKYSTGLRILFDHDRVLFVILSIEYKKLYMWTKIVSKTCGTDGQNGAVRMRRTETCGKTLFKSFLNVGKS